MYRSILVPAVSRDLPLSEEGVRYVCACERNTRIGLLPVIFYAITISLLVLPYSNFRQS